MLEDNLASSPAQVRPPAAPRSRRFRLFQLLAVLVLLAIAAVPALPNYITQEWPWATPPALTNTRALRTLRQEGLTLPGWQTLRHDLVKIGGNDWSIQVIQPAAESSETSPIPAQSPVVLMLRPQNWNRDQPQVDWMDINGVQQWTADSQRRASFSVNLPDLTVSNSTEPNANQGQSVKVNARFLRGWSQQQTFAVLQWYAWTDGGSPNPRDWFWADQVTQWRDRHRMPWVAVSLLIPIKPLGDIETVRSLAETLGQTVQSSLITGPLQYNR